MQRDPQLSYQKMKEAFPVNEPMTNIVQQPFAQKTGMQQRQEEMQRFYSKRDNGHKRIHGS